LTALGMIK